MSDSPSHTNPSTYDGGTWAFRIFVDGGCPLCRREASFMERLDKGRGRLDVVDIAKPDFDPAPLGTDFQSMMDHIHGQEPDGTLVTGVEVFRRSYTVVGWGWLLNWTKLPIIRTIADAAYRFFAKYRLTFTGRKGECAVQTN